MGFDHSKGKVLVVDDSPEMRRYLQTLLELNSYRVQAANAVGTSTPSVQASVTLPTPPSPPTNIRATQVTATEVDLSWRDNAPSATGYNIFRELQHSSITILAASLPPVPALRLVTGSSVAETRTSGARAGRGPVELILPDVPTVSREHARFTFSDGRWWISNQGRNGLILNGTPVTGEQPLSDGDAIRWGSNSDAPLSRVEIS